MWLFVIVLLFVFHLFTKRKFSYWKDLGVKGPSALPFVGNFGNVLFQKKSVIQCIKDIYEQYPEENVVGLYRGFQPMLLIKDPVLIKQILIKDFHIFHDRGLNTSRNRLAENLFSLEGEKWRILRKKLTPVFTSKRLKDMMPLIEICSDNYVNYVEYLIDQNIDHEIKSLAAKYTLQVIVLCAFGFTINTFNESENKFIIMAQRVFTPTFYGRIINSLDMIIPGIRNLFAVNMDLQSFFMDLIKKVIEERKDKPMMRKDFMDFMIKLKDQGKVNRKYEDEYTEEIEIDDELIAAQALVFYAAGYESSSGTMSFLLYELALNQNIQNKVYQEICEVTAKYDNKCTYESLNEMTYLEMVLEETLRKHSVGSTLFRICKSDYVLPETNIRLHKDIAIVISGNGLQHDPKYFPNPEVFNPDNFLPENKIKIPQCTHMPFGEGPRNCIGMRFAIVQSMVGIVAFLKKFKVVPSEKTKKHLDYDPKSITLTSKDGIWLKILKR